MNQFEEKQIYLVESRGVAGSPWRPELVAITEYIQRYVKEEWNKTHQNKYTFYIPEKLVDKISFLTKSVIIVEANYRLYSQTEYVGYCQGRDGFDNVIINNKLSGIEIFISVIFDIHGNVKQQSFFSTLIHEINHAFEIYCNMKNDENIQHITTSTNKYYSKIFDNTIINDIMYYLFCDLEKNALVAEIYGQLYELQSKRENFHNDILNTEGYNVYKRIRDNYQTTINDLSESELQELKHHLFTYNVFTSEKTDDANFKIKLKRKIKYLLNSLIKNICRAASLYYDDIEEKEKKQKKNKLQDLKLYKNI